MKCDLSTMKIENQLISRVMVRLSQNYDDFGMISNSNFDREKQTSNSIKKFVCPRISGTSLFTHAKTRRTG